MLELGAVRATLGNGGELMSLPCWNPDGSELAYIEGCELKIWMVADNTTRSLSRFPDEFTCYHLVFGAGMVGYVKGGFLGWSAFDRLVSMDSKNGATMRTIMEPFNGSTFLINGNTVVCEIGY